MPDSKSEQESLLEYLQHRYPLGTRINIEHDGFSGEVIGWYVRKDLATGVCLQLDNAKVVHVYGEKWVKLT